MRHPPLIVAAHGSTDARFAATVEAVAARVRRLRPALDVRVGYLDHGPPHLADVVEPGAVVVPLLLAHGYHARVDVPEQAPGARVTAAVGPDPALSAALADRLREAGYDGRSPVTLVAAGSADGRAVDDVRLAAALLAGHLGVEVTAAFVGSAEPRLADLAPAVVSTYLVAPGTFHDAVAASGGVVSGPLGDHPAVAATVLARYDGAAPGGPRRDGRDPVAARRQGQVPGRTAPA